MPQKPRVGRVHERWAHLRFSVIGQLLAAPPDTGELRAAIEALAAGTHREKCAHRQHDGLEPLLAHFSRWEPGRAHGSIRRQARDRKSVV